MKKSSFVNLGALVLLTAGAAYAQSTRIEAEIPFAFRAGSQLFPAGQYEVQPAIAPGVVLIKCTNCKAAAMLIANSVTTGALVEKGTLVFNRYGDAYFLSKLWVPGYSTGKEFRKTEAEREWARGGKPSLVNVAVR